MGQAHGAGSAPASSAWPAWPGLLPGWHTLQLAFLSYHALSERDCLLSSGLLCYTRSCRCWWRPAARLQPEAEPRAAERILLERAKGYRFLRAYNPKAVCTQVGFAFESFWLVLGRHAVNLIGRY